MLRMPENPTNATLVGIDPGSVMLGVCTIEIDPLSLEIKRVSPTSYNGEKSNASEWDELAHGDRFARIYALSNRLVELFRRENPTFVASESPFYNRLRPNAYGVLMEVLSEIRNACRRYSPYKTLHLIDPPSVKLAVNAKGQKGKDPVKDGIRSIPELMNNLDVSIDSLDEHAIDATAVAYALLKKLRSEKGIYASKKE